jgi:hypothetical protein
MSRFFVLYFSKITFSQIQIVLFSCLHPFAVTMEE